MSKVIQALLSGMFFTFFIDFFIFLGILLNYIDFYEIDLYYNILFADNQNIYLFFSVSIIFGYLIMYVKSNKVTVYTIGFVSIIALSTLFHPIGHQLGEYLFMSKNKTLYSEKRSFTGDIYYDGRDKITFYDYKLKKIITLNKKELKY